MAFWEKQKAIKALYEQFSRPVRIRHGISQMEFSILLFIDANPDENTAADIVKTCRFTKSHVSVAIMNLEKKALLTRYFLKDNNKIIHLSLTDKAEAILDDARSAGERYRSVLFDGFSEEDLLRVRMYFEKLCQNAEKELEHREETEEDA